ncbi:MAG TPA: hypothetical protein VFO69_05410 [Allosphingosinicella sp.]|nr:hypothetical protein [Allosphingosinicella sp.]
MSAKFLIQADRENGLIRIVMTGFFTRAELDRFIAARAKAHAQLGLPANAHSTLNDVRRMKIQSPEMVEAFRELLAAPDYRSRRLAFVASPTLARSQLMRACTGRDVRFFEDVEVAEAWLLEGAEGAASKQAA